MTKTCATCHQIFEHPARKTKYCGRECYYAMKRLRGDRVQWTDEMRQRMSKAYSGELNPMHHSKGRTNWCKGKKRPEMHGHKHPLYKGGYLTDSGYWMICVEGKEILQHRYVMEQHLGRKLTSEEIVHHKDGNKLHNDIKNLEIMDRSSHARHHNFGTVIRPL